MRRSESAATEELFDNLERSALPVARGGAVQDRADGVNRLTIAANDSADIALTQLDFEDRHFAARNFREHHVVRKLDQLANNELEKFFHDKCCSGALRASLEVFSKQDICGGHRPPLQLSS